MIAAFHGNFDDIDGAREDKLYLLYSRYLFTTKVYLVVPISRKTDKVFELELFVSYSWIPSTTVTLIGFWYIFIHKKARLEFLSSGQKNICREINKKNLPGSI